MEMHFPELHSTEVLRVIQNESNALGPLKYKLAVLLKLKKQTNRGEEEIEFFLRQDPTLLNAFDVKQ